MPELTFFNRLSGAHIKPLCAHPANIPLTLTLSHKPLTGRAPVKGKGRGNILASAGSQAYRRGLPDEGFISGWANVQANNYWSSSTYANNTTNAWNVNMNDGNVNGNNKTNTNYVWPVRAGEWLFSKGFTPHPIPLPQGERGNTGIASFENLYRNYLKCRRNKRNTINALRFEFNAEENLLKLSEELKNKTYQPIRSVCFIVERPKMREIIAADFRDRVVHHLLIERLEAIYERIFIHDSYACRKGKGLHKAVERVREFIRKGSKNGRGKLFFIHMDIKNFFMSIDKNNLYELLRKKVKDEDLLRLAHVIIFHSPTENCVIKGKKHLLNCLPPHKSLFHTPEGRGLPIGNLTSQFFANVYLNELDQYVKHTLKRRYYVRYCDDFLIMDKSPERLEQVKRDIDEFVKHRLNLFLNKKHGKVLPVSNGIDFLGYIIRQDYMLARRRVVNNLKEKLNWFEDRLVSEKEDVKIVKYDYVLLEKLRSVIASYLGHLKWADTYRLRSAILERFNFLKEYFSFELSLPPFNSPLSKGGDRGVKGGIKGGLKPLYRYSQIFPSVRSQYLYYESWFRATVLFFQAGCFYEFYEDTKEDVMAILCLERLKENRRGVKYGFPVRLEEEYTKRFLKEGMPVVIIKETDRYIGKIKERLPIMKISKTKEEKHV